MNKLPTAEEFLDNYINKNNIPWHPDIEELYGSINVCMIEFARLHVQQALQAASEQIEFDEKVLIRQSILQAYPLNLVK